MLKFVQMLWPVVILSLLLTACSGNNADASANTNGNSQVHPLFIERGCIACHVVEAGQEPNIGPSLIGVADRSAETIKLPNYTGQAETPEDYIRESILKPHVYVVEGYAPLMPGTYAASLSQEELDELVNHLLTLQ